MNKPHDQNELKKFETYELEQELRARKEAAVTKAAHNSHQGTTTKHRVSFDIVDRENGTSEMMCSIDPNYLRVKYARQGLIGAEHLAHVAITAVQEALAKRRLNLFAPRPTIIPAKVIPRLKEKK